MDIQKEAHIRVTTEAIAKKENWDVAIAPSPRVVAEEVARGVIGDYYKKMGVKCGYTFDTPDDNTDDGKKAIWVVGHKRNFC